MTKKINILIADNNIDNAKKIYNTLILREDVNEVILVNDGQEVINVLEKIKIDVFVCDLILPYLDGFAIIDRIKQLNLESEPYIIIMSAINNDFVTSKILDVGADYLMIKPIDVDLLVTRIFNLANNIEIDTMNYCFNDDILSMESQITYLINGMGIPMSVKGYVYLKEAISLVIKDVSFLSSVIKRLYPDIAKKYNTTSAKVERAIRYIVEHAWAQEDNLVLEQLFESSTRKTKPSNAEFIATIADKIRLESMLYN